MIKQGSIGKIKEIIIDIGHNRSTQLPFWYFKFSYAGGGTLIDNGSHAILLTIKLLENEGDKIEYVACKLDRNPKQLKIDIKAECLLITKKGCHIRIGCTWIGSKNYQYDISLIGTDGSLILKGANSLIFKDKNGLSDDILINNSDPSYSWRCDTNKFIEAIETKKLPEASGEDAVKCLMIIESLYKSAQNGCQLKI